jgi:bacitracin synthase 3
MSNTINKPLITMFEHISKIYASTIALVDKDVSITYKELNNSANSLAKLMLKKYRLKPGAVVLIGMEKSIQQVIALIAVLKCRCVYVPVPVSFPDDRINEIINISKTKLILTSESLRKRFSNITNLPIFTSKYDNYEPSINLEQNYSLDDDVTIIFTSGSTGKPKGVIHRNLSILNEAINILNSLVFDGFDRKISQNTY